ncbi:phenylacetate--CoA ligase family protein [Streptomyces antarcticus]|uniref:phenylacetate--CoA ligase family protein n=1 Tax=Streptomyces antarcticus TaxID=2996458 RepID=UPI0022701DB9|nr:MULTISPECIES: AMP-binding protein [unclassified Streptomyces]MCY0942925.1 AMP-binding protein [Streptomyces sp. H34-AA3]MCY0953028.1 AMP-binding protein [Streptomyces sp. H27-S2]MCZ4083115.1 AMP-binding protein [Streptomyces sp. H34-S5]
MSAATVSGSPAATGLPAFWAAYEPVLEAFHRGEMTDEGWSRWQSERLTSVLRHVTARSPFYRRHLAGVDIEQVTPQNLPSLPFTTKEDLRREMYDVLSGSPAEASVFYETTGTTGASTPCPRGVKDIATSNAAVEESWRRLFQAHFGDRMPVVGLMGPSELYAFGDVFTAVTAALGACHVKIWPESPRVGFKKALRLIEELGVEVIVCAPALCLSLAKAALHYGYDLSKLPVKMFLVLGEICTAEFSANVSSVWPHAEVYPTLYGSQESLCIATGSATGDLHLSQPNYLFELVDPDTGEFLGTTGEGELVLTMLVDGIKPLIRYRTGDLVRITPATPGAALPGPVVEVVGRSSDRIQLGESVLHPAELESAVLDGVRGCLGYQVVIDRAPDGGDEVTVRMDILPRAHAQRAAVSASVAARLRERAGVEVSISVEAELDPVTNTGSFVSWKAARVLDNRGPLDTSVLVARQVAHRYAITS